MIMQRTIFALPMRREPPRFARRLQTTDRYGLILSAKKRPRVACNSPRPEILGGPGGQDRRKGNVPVLGGTLRPWKI